MFAFARWPLGDKWLFAAALSLLIVAAPALRVLPIRFLMPLFGASLGAYASVPLANSGQETLARRIRCAILRAVRLSPLRADCLPQALVCAVLCRMTGVPLATFFGAYRNEAGDWATHAWTRSGKVAVTGGDSFSRFAVLNCFHTPSPSHMSASGWM